MAPTACKRMVSGSISLSCSEYFSPFPHGTCSLSVSLEYLALPDGPGRFRQNFTCSVLLRILLDYKFISYTGLSPSMVIFFQKYSIINLYIISQSYNPNIAKTILVWAIPISFATTLGITICFLFLWLLRCFSSPGSLPNKRIINLQLIGLPHSEISGSKVICTSPKLIAACHVLHSHREPRHPPYALSNF